MPVSGFGPIISATDRCELCPRRCGADRRAGEKGFCGAGVEMEIYSYGRHCGEEPPVSGTRGSGTVFFSRCTLRCLYCQNHPWSQEARGDRYDAAGLAAVFRSLADEGCHNWNLVSPTPWIPGIVQALEMVQKKGRRLPVVYNTSGYERAETIRELSGVAQVYLADLRYSRPESALEGSGAADYVKAARKAFLEMWSQAGALRVDSEGIAQSGVICRLLVLPGRAVEACENLEWLKANAGAGVCISLMSQYIPAHLAGGRPGWDRGISRAEYDMVLQAAMDMGFENGHVQDFGGRAARDLVGFNMKQGRKT
mgnify:CR=1 FL=1